MLQRLLQAYNYARRLFISRDSLPYIHMQSGARFVHSWPLAEDVTIEDIANNLSKLCRYCGSIEGDNAIYSVAEHCVRSSYIEPQWDALEKLLHDGSETFVVDLPRPLKYSPFMGVYKFYEHLADTVVAEKFHLKTDAITTANVKYADKVMLVTEKRDLFAQDRVMCLNKMDDAEGITPLPEKIVPWTPEQAKRAFLMRFYELTGEEEFYKQHMTVTDSLWSGWRKWKKFYLLKTL